MLPPELNLPPSYFPLLKLIFPLTGTRAPGLYGPCRLGKDFVHPVLRQKYGTFPVRARINIKRLT